MSPYSCVMLRSEGRLQHPTPPTSHTQLCKSLSAFCRGAAAWAHGHTILLPSLWHLREWMDNTLNVNTCIFQIHWNTHTLTMTVSKPVFLLPLSCRVVDYSLPIKEVNIFPRLVQTATVGRLIVVILSFMHIRWTVTSCWVMCLHANHDWPLSNNIPACKCLHSGVSNKSNQVQIKSNNSSFNSTVTGYYEGIQSISTRK